MNDDATDAACPLPQEAADCVTLAHGGGGALMQRLVREVFAAAFANDARHDGARVDTGTGSVVTTADAFVVKPLFFPGGDIGALAVHGTVNDLAMCGARPLALTAAFVIEEGYAVDDLRRIAASMASAARAAGVAIVSGDTKVVERGHGDGIYVTTSGIGVQEHGLDIHPRAIVTGDAVILSGDIGRHGTAVMAAREGLATTTPILSDQQNLWPAVQALLAAGIELHCLRDLTRGGLATALVELARDGGWGIAVDETAIAIQPAIAALCELFGLDPLYVANEGRFVAVVPNAQAEAALAVLRGFDAAANLLGQVSDARDGRVRLRTRYGTTRHVALLSGAQLPRIC
ncbi:MAG: hydrogenase expression/formation protein HypE [Gammaproteobacteria bacterium]